MICQTVLDSNSPKVVSQTRYLLNLENTVSQMLDPVAYIRTTTWMKGVLFAVIKGIMFTIGASIGEGIVVLMEVAIAFAIVAAICWFGEK